MSDDIVAFCKEFHLFIFLFHRHDKLIVVVCGSVSSWRFSEILKDLELCGFIASDSGLNPETGSAMRTFKYREDFWDCEHWLSGGYERGFLGRFRIARLSCFVSHNRVYCAGGIWYNVANVKGET